MRSRFRIIDLVVIGLCILASLGMLLYYLIAGNDLPAEIPARFSFTGKISGYSGHSILLSSPIILLVLTLILSFVSSFPSAWNLPGVRITEENLPRISAVIRTMMDIMLLTVAAVFTAMFICQARACRMPFFIMPAMLVIFLINVIVGVIRCHRVA